MASIYSNTKPTQIINRKLVNFDPPEYEKIKSTLINDIDVVARSFCESELTMLNAIKSGKVHIGVLDNYSGNYCIYIEYSGAQVIKPVHVCH